MAHAQTSSQIVLKRQNCMTQSPPDIAVLSIPPANFVNDLEIKGRISAKARGKELVIAICNSNTRKNFVFRVGFDLEGHCFWMPTAWYHRIVSASRVPRGCKSRAFAIPNEFIDGPVNTKPGSDLKISIQAAFIRPNWTLVFVDHNMMISFHLMQMSDSFSREDLNPASFIRSSLWSRSHGPVYNLEPAATLRALDDWRPQILTGSPGDNTPIFTLIKADQTVFNGSGVQETTDLLLLALIHPLMPAINICSYEEPWNHFCRALIDYDTMRIGLAMPGSPLPYVSGPRPLRMNTDGHKKYLSIISSYRRSLAIFSAETLATAHKLGLFVPNAVIQPDGQAAVPLDTLPAPLSITTKLRLDRNQAKVQILNFVITPLHGKVTFSPFTAQAPKNWVKSERATVGSDVREESNSLPGHALC
ncbi:hypothetical protein C8R44DRAFT_881241 [Mycena epipterygia]|nr:hypothetical protein C8R44DRAFT_881241 [Mycena epipterygia]